MSHLRQHLFTCLTHVIALAAGWFAWSQWHTPANANSALNQSPTKAGSPVKPGEVSTEEILASLVPSPAKQAAQQKAANAEDKEFERLIETMEVPADFPAALSKEIAEWLKDGSDRRKPSPMIMALLYHWTTRDVAAMTKWAETDPSTQEAMMWHCFPVYAKVVKDKGPAVLTGGLSGPFGKFAGLFMADGLAHSDETQVLALKSTLSDAQWKEVRGQFKDAWPFTQKDTLAKIAIADKQPELLLEFARKKGTDGMKWLRGLLADESLDAEFKEQATASTAWKDYVRNDSSMPLDQRLKLLAGENQTPAPELYEQIAGKDLSAILKNGRDWRNVFRHGDADAAEVLAAMAKELPELASRAPDALRNRLYFELVEEDPERAMALLDGLPEAEKTRIAMDAARRAFGNIDPNQFVTALGKVPADTPELWDARLAAWAQNTTGNHLRLSDDYVAWVRNLPPGLDREMALFSLANTVRGKNAPLAAELRGEITDATLKKRIEEGQ